LRFGFRNAFYSKRLLTSIFRGEGFNKNQSLTSLSGIDFLPLQNWGHHGG